VTSIFLINLENLISNKLDMIMPRHDHWIFVILNLVLWFICLCLPYSDVFVISYVSHCGCQYVMLTLVLILILVSNWLTNAAFQLWKHRYGFTLWCNAEGVHTTSDCCKVRKNNVINSFCCVCCQAQSY